MSSDFISPYVIGIPVSGSKFFGRTNQLDYFFKMLTSPILQPMRVMGLRRSGKTSFLRHAAVCESAQQLLNRKGPRTVIAYVDLQMEITDVNKFCKEVIKAVNKVIPAECTLPNEYNGFDTLTTWLENIFDKNLRCVVLLDEYEVLTDITNNNFDISFFQALRSICCGTLLSNFTWVTCSNFSLYPNSPQERGLDKSSHFENIFHPKPIIIGGLTFNELRDLINKPIESEHISFSLKEVNTIQSIAGTLPYLIQTVAHEWYILKKRGISKKNQLAEVVIEAIVYSEGEIDRLFGNFWNTFTSEERRCFLRLIQKGQNIKSNTFIETKFLDYGLLKENKGSISFNGKLFQTWIFKNIQISDSSGESNMLQSDINRAQKRIEKIKKTIYDLKNRMNNLKSSRAKLNKITQRVEYDSYSEQIDEFEQTINDFEEELYTERNHFLLLILDDNNFLELKSKIDDRLSTIPTNKINELYPHYKKLQAELKKASVSVPSQLVEAEHVDETESTSNEEKRTKVKFSLSLLGPKIEVEKMFIDSNVRNGWTNFWKKVKEVVL